jgi:hypothetical protein
MDMVDRMGWTGGALAKSSNEIREERWHKRYG